MVKIDSTSKFQRFHWTAPGIGIENLVDTDNLKSPYFREENPQANILRTLISNELNLASKENKKAKVPKHIEYMQKHELVDYCDVSERGHLKWYPKGLLIQKLLLEYARELAHDWGAFEIKNPILIRGDNNLVGQLMGEFYEHDYKVDGGRGECLLRYASDPLGFPFMQKVRISEAQTPMKVYEEASCFRNEIEGAVSGLKRVRNFLMTDMHAACVCEEQARSEFETLTYRFGELMNDVIAKERWVLGWEGTFDFFDKNKEWLKNISDKMGVPAFYKLMPEMSHYYAIKNEFQSILEDGGNIQVSTVQWDVKNGPRFDIGYTASDGNRKPCSVILHASSFGSIERTLCTILENIAIDQTEGKIPEFPLWLSPTQARVIPVSSAQNGYAEKCMKELSELRIRADYDDRNLTLGKKIRNAGKEWTPYVCVVGEKEVNNGTMSVRRRLDQKNNLLTPTELMQEIFQQTKGMSYLPIPLSKYISKRPLFR